MQRVDFFFPSFFEIDKVFWTLILFAESAKNFLSLSFHFFICFPLSSSFFHLFSRRREFQKRQNYTLHANRRKNQNFGLFSPAFFSPGPAWSRSFFKFREPLPLQKGKPWPLNTKEEYTNNLVRQKIKNKTKSTCMLCGYKYNYILHFIKTHLILCLVFFLTSYNNRIGKCWILQTVRTFAIAEILNFICTAIMRNNSENLSHR